MKTYYHVTTELSIEAIKKDGLMPQIGKMSIASNEKESRVYLFPDKESLYDAMENWLIESLENIYGENIGLCLLELHLPDDFPIQSGEVDYEKYSYQIIPPQFIKTIESI